MFNIIDFLSSHGVSPSVARVWGPLYLQTMKRYGIDTPNRVAGFFSNVIHESSGFTRLVENMNYSKERLVQVWPNRFSTNGRANGQPNALAIKLHRNPQAIANSVYANRMGNGSPESGDGWKYRGRGPMQTTGKNNYISVSEQTGLDCVTNPELLATPQGGVLASCLFWYNNPCRTYADKDDFDGLRDVINIGHKTTKIGDAHGYQEAYSLYKRMKVWITNNGNAIQ